MPSNRPNDWNENREEPPVFQWLLLALCLALLAYLFAEL